MAKLKEIRIYTSRAAKNRPDFQVKVGGVLWLYNMLLPKNVLFYCNYVNIYLTNIHSEVGIKEEVQNFLDIYVFFDFDLFSRIIDPYAKSKVILDVINDGILMACRAYRIDDLPFIETYKKCYEKKLECKWFFRNKLFRSPDKKRYIALEHEIDFDGLKIFEILYDFQKNEIARRVCFESETSNFIIQWASWNESNEVFYYSFSNNDIFFSPGPKKIFKCVIHELEEGILYPPFKKASDYFKG